MTLDLYVFEFPHFVQTYFYPLSQFSLLPFYPHPPSFFTLEFFVARNDDLRRMSLQIFRKQRSSPPDCEGGGGRPRSRTMDASSSMQPPHRSSSSSSSSTREMDIGRPMNFKHNVNVRMESDGTFSGMPDEWLTILLKQVRQKCKSLMQNLCRNG